MCETATTLVLGRVLIGVWLLAFWAWRQVPILFHVDGTDITDQGQESGYADPDIISTKLYSWQFLLQSLARESSDACKVLVETTQQEWMVPHAYKQAEVLRFAKEENLDWLSYARGVENLAIRIFDVGGVDKFDFGRDVGRAKELFVAKYGLADTQVLVMMETHANATVWGYDQKGNRVLLVNRGGLPNETNLEVVQAAYRERFGEGAGMVLFEAHLAHEMTHCRQIWNQPFFYVPTLEDYQQSEIKAYEASIAIKRTGMIFYKCLF